MAAQVARSCAAQYQVGWVLAVYVVDEIKFRNLMSIHKRLVMPPTSMKVRNGAVERLTVFARLTCGLKRGCMGSCEREFAECTYIEERCWEHSSR